MGKIYGALGYSTVSESTTQPGVWTESVTERYYYGDLVRNNRRLQNGPEVNDDIFISNEISIVADPFAYENIYAIKYFTYLGVKWKVVSVDVQRPRLILTLGGVYNA